MYKDLVEGYRFGISSVARTSIRDLDLDIIRDYFMKYNTFDLFEESDDSVERILENADILKEVDGKKLCTVGGLLIFGKRPERYLPQSGVSFDHSKLECWCMMIG